MGHSEDNLNGILKEKRRSFVTYWAAMMEEPTMKRSSLA